MSQSVKKRKTKSSKRKVIERPFNCSTMTNAGFFGMIRAALRSKSRWYKPIALCKKLAKRPYKGPNKKQRFEYQCNLCKNWFPEKQVSVDHIIPAGKLSKFEDLPGFVQRLFVEVEGLQCLCSQCHSTKTLNDRLKLKEEGERIDVQSTYIGDKRV